jgi:hypothetical protein
MEKDKLIRELTTAARQRLDCCNRLVGLADKQRAVLLGSRHSDLAENLANFDPLLMEMNSIEKQEQGLLARFTESGGDDPGPEYRVLKGRIAESAGLLHQISETNKQLITRHMEYVSFSLGLVLRFATEQSIIGPGNNPALMLDSKV